MTAPHFFLKSAGAWKWNDGVGHDGGKSLSGMSRQTKPQSSSRRISHRGHAVSIIPFQHTLRPRGHIISNTPRIQYSIHARHGFSMRDARCFASSFRIPFGTEAARFIHGHLRTYHTEPSFVSSVMRWRFMTQESLFRHDGNTFPPGTRHSICILLSYDSPSSPASRASVFLLAMRTVSCPSETGIPGSRGWQGSCGNICPVSSGGIWQWCLPLPFPVLSVISKTVRTIILSMISWFPVDKILSFRNLFLTYGTFRETVSILQRLRFSDWQPLHNAISVSIR